MKGEYHLKKSIKSMKNKFLTKNTILYLIAIILLALFILLCYITNKYKLPTFDLTESKLFSISDISKEQLKNLRYDVFIYFFGNEMDEDLSIYGIAEKYSKINNKIKTEVIIPSENQEFCEKYGLTTDVNAIIVRAANDNYKILRMSDFYTTNQIDNSFLDLTEEKLTNAILDVEVQNRPNVYFLTGHSENTNLEFLKYYIENEIYNIKTLDISANENKVPDDCNCLIISSPQTDFTDIDFTAISNYINLGGSIIWLGNNNTSYFTNIQKILDLYGAKITGDSVYETSYLYNLDGNTNTLLATLVEHTITKDIISSGYVTLFNPSRLEIIDDARLSELGVTANIFLKSSSTSVIKDLSDSSSPKITDTASSYNIGGEFIKKISDSTYSKLVLIADSSFVSDKVSINSTNYPGVSIGNNKDIILNSISYLTGRTHLSIKKSTPIISVLSADDNFKAGLSVIVIYVIPILILLAGLIVWIVRRRKK